MPGDMLMWSVHILTACKNVYCTHALRAPYWNSGGVGSNPIQGSSVFFSIIHCSALDLCICLAQFLSYARTHLVG